MGEVSDRDESGRLEPGRRRCSAVASGAASEGGDALGIGGLQRRCGLQN